MTKRVLNHQQLKMFMSPEEIHSVYQPLDGDRMSWFGGTDSSDDHLTNRPTSSSDGSPGGGQETDDELWDRKLDEAHDTYGHDGRSMARSIEEEGVKHPIRLGSQRGSQGKPQIVGGHHRLAVQTDLDPKELLPVLHDEDIWHAQGFGTPIGKPQAYPYR